VNENLAKTGLLIIDAQTGVFHKSTPLYKAKELLENIQTHTERAHQAGVPVIYIQHSNDTFLAKDSADWQLHVDQFLKFLLPQNRTAPKCNLRSNCVDRGIVLDRSSQDRLR